MRRLLNTLYVTTQGAYLAKDGETVLVRVEQETKLRVPVHQLGGIVCFGQVSVSPFLMGFCAERDVGIAFLTENGRFLARVQGPVSGNVLLRREQYRAADDPVRTAAIAGSVVSAKIANCRALIQRGSRERDGDVPEAYFSTSLRALADALSCLCREESVDTIRGIEGAAARAYFDVFGGLIAHQKEEFYFRERSRRPPLDNVNALLSFVYTLIRHDIQSGLETVGLDPAVGFLHRDRPGRPGLALDLMEELRAPLADRLVLSLINLRQVNASGFRREEAGGVVMDDDTRKTVITSYQKRKQDEIEHPFLQEKIAIGLLPFVQSLLLARYLRGDLDAYPAMFWK